ncbi:unnamed protein product [Periconia digitata]|uniref:Uncharacterized protein n=1 Tax=Periconia digitata TaxID=1303443 RepID=A0A9W4UMK6_9PLEO|nr:unnamed protein product [Periconia digitata]
MCSWKGLKQPFQVCKVEQFKLNWFFFFCKNSTLRFVLLMDETWSLEGALFRPRARHSVVSCVVYGLFAE